MGEDGVCDSRPGAWAARGLHVGLRWPRGQPSSPSGGRPSGRGLTDQLWRGRKEPLGPWSGRRRLPKPPATRPVRPVWRPATSSLYERLVTAACQGRLSPRGSKWLFCSCALCSPPLRWGRGRPGHGLWGHGSEPGARPPAWTEPGTSRCEGRSLAILTTLLLIPLLRFFCHYGKSHISADTEMSTVTTVTIIQHLGPVLFYPSIPT